MADLATTIETLTGKPQAVSGDAGSVTMPKIPEAIAGAQFIAAAAGAAKKKTRGLRFNKIIQPTQIGTSTDDA